MTDDLKFIRVFDGNLVPRYLLEQIKKLDEKMIERFYQAAPLIMQNPFEFVFILADKEHKIKGVLWASIDLIEAVWFIQLYSIDKEYQKNNADNLKSAAEFLLSLPTGPEMKKEIRWATDRPEAFERAGFKRQTQILMELKQNEKSITV